VLEGENDLYYKEKNKNKEVTERLEKFLLKTVELEFNTKVLLEDHALQLK